MATWNVNDASDFINASYQQVRGWWQSMDRGEQESAIVFGSIGLVLTLLVLRLVLRRIWIALNALFGYSIEDSKLRAKVNQLEARLDALSAAGGTPTSVVSKDEDDNDEDDDEDEDEDDTEDPVVTELKTKVDELEETVNDMTDENERLNALIGAYIFGGSELTVAAFQQARNAILAAFDQRIARAVADNEFGDQLEELYQATRTKVNAAALATTLADTDSITTAAEKLRAQAFASLLKDPSNDTISELAAAVKPLVIEAIVADKAAIAAAVAADGNSLLAERIKRFLERAAQGKDKWQPGDNIALNALDEAIRTAFTELLQSSPLIAQSVRASGSGPITELTAKLIARVMGSTDQQTPADKVTRAQVEESVRGQIVSGSATIAAPVVKSTKQPSENGVPTTA